MDERFGEVGAIDVIMISFADQDGEVIMAVYTIQSELC